MDQSRRVTRPRKRSSPEVVARLQRSRRRAMDRRAAAREREKIVTTAVRDYISAWHAIELVQQRRDNEIANLKGQIDIATARAADEITGHEQGQIEAAATIHAEGHNDDDIADLLEISTRQARQLIAASRKNVGDNTARTSPSDPSSAIEHPSGRSKPDEGNVALTRNKDSGTTNGGSSSGLSGDSGT